MIDAFAEGPSLDYSNLSAPDFRGAFDVPSPAANGSALARIEDRTCPGPNGPVRVRLYHPKGVGPHPITLYIHGGGFVIGSPETTDGICQSLAVGAQSLVISPDYRLAPEAPFPTGLDDCWAALHWTASQAETLGGDARRLAVGGDSSGGNFAAAIAQMAGRSGPPLQHQLLLYPVLDHNFETGSYAEFAQGYFLTAEMMRWFWRQYLPGADKDDLRASPLRENALTNLPPATIVTAEYDVLRDEAELYACKLIRSGVPTKVMRYAGQIHGFLLQQGIIDDADAALAAAAKELGSALHG